MSDPDMNHHDELICPICCEYFVNVLETPCCSRGYCSSCLEGSLKSTKGTCPSCTKPLNIFSCTSNKMIQRMVDNLPAKCVHPGCTAKITRSILKEHVSKCPNRPNCSTDNNQCTIHDQPRRYKCELDDQLLCSYCVLVGQHRSHKLILNPDYSNRNDDQVDILASTFQTISTNVNPPLAKLDARQVELEYERLKDEYHQTQFNFNGVKLTAFPLCSKLLPKVTNHVYVLLEIRVGQKEIKASHRPPFSLSLVLDRSGSMEGARLNTAKVAIQGVIENLLPGDQLHLVQYDDTACTVFENGNYNNKNELKKIVDRIHTGGCTNLADGVLLGEKILHKYPGQPTKKIFLFSDGQANVGIKSVTEVCALVEKINSEGVGVSAFGIGEGFDEAMMKGIARYGNGHYFFVDSPNEIPNVLDKAFKGLERTVAKDVVLKVRSPYGKVTTLKGEDLMDGIKLGDMRDKDLKQVLLQVEVLPENTEFTEVISYELSYNKLDELVPDGPIVGSVNLQLSDIQEDMFKFNQEALVAFTIHDCGQLDAKIVKMMESRQMTEAVALKKKVVHALESIVSLDKIGFAKVLLMRAQSRLDDLIGLQNGSGKVNYEVAKKAIDRDALEEEDEDMGFGLFD